jgi:predicted Rossmann-fold nucleotide-binding protein
MRKTIIGVMGPAEVATDNDLKNAFELGKLIALNGWVLLSGGANYGVMDACL